MPFSIEEFRRYLTIDKLALDDEVVRQPSLFFEVSEAYAEAVSVRDAAKENLALVDAELDAEARSDKEKITEGQVKAAIAASQDHTDAAKLWLAAKEEADKLQALKDAFQQRSYMLRDLVSLYTANYFEQNSLRTSAQQDKVVYSRQRERLAASRDSKR